MLHKCINQDNKFKDIIKYNLSNILNFNNHNFINHNNNLYYHININNNKLFNL